MAYAVIELLMLNFALNSPFGQTLVVCRLSFSVFMSFFFVECESSFDFGRMEKPSAFKHIWLSFLV